MHNYHALLCRYHSRQRAGGLVITLSRVVNGAYCNVSSIIVCAGALARIAVTLLVIIRLLYSLVVIVTIVLLYNCIFFFTLIYIRLARFLHTIRKIINFTIQAYS